MKEEREIISAILAGKRDLFSGLVERYHKGLCFYIFNLIGDQEKVEDITQEAFLKAYTKLNKYKFEYSFSTWLYRIARNIALKEIEKEKKYSSYDIEKLNIKSGENIQERYQKLEEAAKVRQVVQNMEPRYREVISLFYWEEKSYEEISKIIRRPMGTVRTWIHRAKEQIRKELQK